MTKTHRFNWVQFCVGFPVTAVVCFFVIPPADNLWIRWATTFGPALVVAYVAGRKGGEVWEAFVNLLS